MTFWFILRTFLNMCCKCKQCSRDYWKTDVKAEKCELHVSSISFLGYVLAGGQVKTDSAKVKAVTKWFLDSLR